LATTFVLAPLLMGLDGILSLVMDLTLPVRIVAPAVILGLVGAGLGVSLALAVRIASSWGVRVGSSAIAYAGASAALAMLVGTLLSMTWGYSASLLAGAATMILSVIFASPGWIDSPDESTDDSPDESTDDSPDVRIDFEPLSAEELAADDEPISFAEKAPPSTTSSV
jgi:hypothetical protein